VIKTLAVVGATGAVGQIVLDEIVRQGLQYETLRLLASSRSAGQVVTVAGRDITVERLARESFAGVDVVIASTPDEVAAEFIPWAVEAGATVVDESGYFRMDPKVPLIIPEVNAEDVDHHQGIISSPNCSTTQMVVGPQALV
jgi:aspartate-semialdehyde dehydrogenase